VEKWNKLRFLKAKIRYICPLATHHHIIPESYRMLIRYDSGMTKECLPLEFLQKGRDIPRKCIDQPMKIPGRITGD